MPRHRPLALLLCLALNPWAVQSARAAQSPTSVTLHWTAPGDDGNVGTARFYDLRFSTMPITDANFGLCATLYGVPTPQPAGSAESYLATNLDPTKTYYFALKTWDDHGNVSKLSNIVVVTGQTTAVDIVPGPTWLSPASPNPARSATRLTLAVSHDGPVRVDAFDVAGQHVRTVEAGWRKAGAGELAWDLRDDSGRDVPSGIYLVRASLNDRVLTSRVCVIR